MKRIVLVVMLILIGVLIGISPFGTRIKCLYYKSRFGGYAIAENYVKSPFNLKINYVLNADEKLEIYLIDEASKQRLPMLHINGSMQVGDFNHRLLGLQAEAKSKIVTGITGVRFKLIHQLEKFLEEMKE
ncbi:MAG: hypothetical protein JSV56_04555 [Methanomassiliicoccales archaeon]|nr:MAG: hypothetical protein JSV56_04555 [Methanomassiliicoccales archaeon]